MSPPLRDLRRRPRRSRRAAGPNRVPTNGDPYVQARARPTSTSSPSPATASPCSAGARAPVAGRGHGPQVGHPRLRGLHLRPATSTSSRTPCRPRGAGTPPCTSSTRAAWPACRPTSRAEFGPAIDTQDIGGGLPGRARGGGRRGVAGLRQRRLLGEEHERPGPRLPAHRGRDRSYYLLGYNPAEHRRATAASARSRSRSRAKDLKVRARKGYFAPLDAASRGQPRSRCAGRPRHPGGARLAVRGAGRSHPHDRLRVRRDPAGQGQRARRDRRGRPRVRLQGGGRALRWTRVEFLLWSPTWRRASSSATTRRST